MKCQVCDNAATHHVTEIVAGKPVEYHVCDSHLPDVEKLEPAGGHRGLTTAFSAFMGDPELCELLRDPEARQKLAAGVLPPLYLALLDQRPEVRVMAAFRLMALGKDAQSALGALQDALQDPDARVRKAAAIAVEYIQHAPEPAEWL